VVLHWAGGLFGRAAVSILPRAIGVEAVARAARRIYTTLLMKGPVPF